MSPNVVEKLGLPASRRTSAGAERFAQSTAARIGVAGLFAALPVAMPTSADTTDLRSQLEPKVVQVQRELPPKLATLLGLLDHNEFTLREQAHAELVRLGKDIFPYRAAFFQNATAEQRIHLVQIFEPLNLEDAFAGTSVHLSEADRSSPRPPIWSAYLDSLNQQTGERVFVPKLSDVRKQRLPPNAHGMPQWDLLSLLQQQHGPSYFERHRDGVLALTPDSTPAVLSVNGGIAAQGQQRNEFFSVSFLSGHTFPIHEITPKDAWLEAGGKRFSLFRDDPVDPIRALEPSISATDRLFFRLPTMPKETKGTLYITTDISAFTAEERKIKYLDQDEALAGQDFQMRYTVERNRQPTQVGYKACLELQGEPHSTRFVSGMLNFRGRGADGQPLTMMDWKTEMWWQQDHGVQGTRHTVHFMEDPVEVSALVPNKRFEKKGLRFSWEVTPAFRPDENFQPMELQRTGK